MRRGGTISAAGLACALATGLVAPVGAVEFRSIATAAAVLYDGPSVKSRRLYVAPRGMPVEIVSTADPLWIKARDVGGDVFWVARTDLGEVRSVITAAPANVRQAASDTAPVVFRAERGVLLEPVELAAGGWVRVRHRDGASGYVRTSEIWGL